MGIKRATWRAVALSAATVVALAGCGGGATAPANQAGNTAGGGGTQGGGTVTNLTFDFPVAVSGPIAQKVQALVQAFNDSHPNIKVTANFTGDYTSTMTKVQTAFKAGSPPDVAVLLSTDLFTLKDMGAIVPVDDLASQAGATDWLQSFYPAFMKNSQADGKTWSVPFQRSTLVLYYNKDLFQKAGISQPPQTWDELVADAQKLTKPDGSQWGLEIPTSGLTYWEFQPFAIENGKNVVGDAANKVYFDDPKVVEALQFFVDLPNKYKVEPKGLINWATAPTDFTTGKAAMIYHSSGSLANILQQAKFNVGVAFLPKKEQFGTPTGGGNLYIFKTTPEKEKAALTFAQWLTSPDNAAKWSMETGYIAVTPKAYDTQAMKDYLAKTPQGAVARDQLQYADKELATHEGQQVQQILSTACQEALTGKKTPEQALKDAQQKADQLLSKYSS
ncbi:MAG: ABC transporter substrate-binding protein [Alicyclobacillus macrosporangiidus]|uniref:ABC transporter substrate-binding protein n=1 Tax=Alicyclobacillus macrosporangiidus TaxID=392015 RepID=UPI0026E97AAD|nr:ABC transporter substrate-binding protein [Alicyclobacillus macrosporangiidus]MCL6598986.1 ABC transporter substrate-binding protein [Alicyclobacillus macrosporangiidus]